MQKEIKPATISAKDGGVLFNFMKPIYEQFSKAGVPETIHGCNDFEDFARVATQGKGNFVCDVKLPNIAPAPNNNKVLVAYTGGKDSTAEAIRLKNLGYEVHLFFIKGLNRAYPGEYESAVKIAEIIGCEMHETEVKISGKIFHPENPIKNQITLALLTDWGIANGFGKFGSGVVNAFNTNYEYNWSDTAALMEEFKKFLRAVVPGWEYVNCNVHPESENLAEVLKHPRAKEIFALKSSCMGPHRFRKVWRENVLKKFGVKLDENQCGLCYKCAYEYVVCSAITGKVTSQKYLSKCVETLRGKLYDQLQHKDIFEWADVTFGERIAKLVLKII